MNVQTQRFGEIDVPEHAIIQFPDGILGFPQLRRGCLLPYQPAPTPYVEQELVARPTPGGPPSRSAVADLGTSCPGASLPQPPPAPQLEPVLRWLQSLDDPSLLFLTVEPYLIFPDYDVELSDADAGALQLDTADHAAILTLITISQAGKARRDTPAASRAPAVSAPASRAAVTTNLLAPIVINTRTRRARQVILDSDRYLTKHIIGAQIEEGPNAGADPKTR
jgi:flagellar assembly factor FliW